MTAEEKLAIIRLEMEKSFCHYAHLSYEGFKSTYVLEREAIYKDLIDYIDKIIAEDEDYVSKGMDYMDEDVVAAARKDASGINYSTMTATEIYIKGFNSGQYWRQQNPKTE